jgi:hypothetical protein
VPVLSAVACCLAMRMSCLRAAGRPGGRLNRPRDFRRLVDGPAHHPEHDELRAAIGGELDWLCSADGRYRASSGSAGKVWSCHSSREVSSR